MSQIPELPNIDDIELPIPKVDDLKNIVNSISSYSTDELNTFLSELHNVNMLNPNKNKYSSCNKQFILQELAAERRVEEANRVYNASKIHTPYYTTDNGTNYDKYDNYDW
jgi:uncharacterized protein YpbB